MPQRRAMTRDREPSIHLSLDYDYGHLPYSSIAKATPLIVTLLSESRHRRSRIHHRYWMTPGGEYARNKLMRLSFCFHRSNTWEVSNGIAAFAIFRGSWRGAALRSGRRAPTCRSAGLITADSGFRERDGIRFIRSIATRRPIERGGKTVFDRCASDPARRR